LTVGLLRRDHARVPASIKPLIIINNAAAKARQAWPIARAQLATHDVAFDFHETRQAGDATGRVRAALKAGTNTIAVVGGDGTLSEAAQGFFEFHKRIEELPSSVNPSAVLAILPAGTGDDFARSEMGARKPLATWIDLLMSYCREPSDKQVRPVDVLYGVCDNYQTPFICINASTMGIGGETAARVAAQGKLLRKLSGEGRFALAAVAALAGWRERRVRVSVDDREIIEGNMNLVGVANALYAGGGMMLSPEAQIDDGKLDVITASGLNRPNIMRELTRIHRGGHVANPKVRITQGEKVAVETFSDADAMRIEADGNVRGVTPVKFSVMPGALRFVVSKDNAYT
jgi:diacylglycerol kinase (ATP)